MMTQHNNKNNKFSRRTVLLTTTGLLTTSALTVALTTQSTSATIDPTFSVPDSQLIDEDGKPSGIYLFASGSWSYRVNTEVAEIAVALFTRDINDGFHVVDVTETPTTLQEDTGTFDLGGDLLLTDAWSQNDFTAPGPGLSITRNVPVGVLLRVLDSNGGLITDGRATTTASIMVEETELSASVGGVGEVVFWEDAGDPTPTPS